MFFLPGAQDLLQSSLFLAVRAISGKVFQFVGVLLQIKELQLLKTQLTKNGVDALREALPKCEILYSPRTLQPIERFRSKDRAAIY